MQKFLDINEMRLLKLLFAVAVLTFTDADIFSQKYLYVSLQGEDKVAAYSINPIDGTLAFIYREAVSGGPASIALHPSKRYLYVARRNDHMISAYSIDSLTGRLRLINEIAAVDDPVYISTDQKGNFLLSAYYNASKAAVYSISDDGSLVDPAIKEISTGTNPHAIISDPSNQFMYITNMTGNRIEQYSFDEQTGNFEQLTPFDIVPEEKDCPRHLVFNRDGSILYVADEVRNRITAYRKDINTGQLTSIEILSTIPDSFTEFTKCADIHITRDNRFVYVSNRGHESIAGFKINDSDGKLSLTGYYPTVGTPREMDIEPSGNFLYAAGETSNNLRCYHIQEDGALDSLYTLFVGKTPSWVTTVDYFAGPKEVSPGH